MGFENLPKELVAKIQKLLKLQERASTVEEAANAASKVRDMLMKYNLDLQDVRNAGDLTTKEEPIVKPAFDTGDLTKKSEGGWIRSLTDNIARHNMCTVVGTGSTIGKIYIIGTQTNAELVWLMVTDLSERLRGMCKEAFRTYQGREKWGTYRRGYLAGAVDGIDRQMITKIHEDNEKARIARTILLSERSEEQTYALQVVNMTEVMKVKVTDAMYAFFPNLGTRKSSSLSSVGGRAQGIKDGSSMSLGGSISKTRRLN